MRFYHLADLHFGKSVYGQSMLEDQRFWTERFLEICAAGRPQAVLIAGDVYDRSAPSADAVVLLDRLLTELSEMGIPVLMIAGNHDSGQRLSFGKTMLSRQNIHIAGTVQKEMEHVTFPDPDGFGPVDFWLMPYLFPEQVSELLQDDTVRSYEAAVRKLLSLQNIDPSGRNVILSHQNVTAFGKEMERDGSESMIGGVGQVDYSAYDLFDYAALGHIHSSYPVGRDAVRYAGTPLCYHFSETGKTGRGFLEVDLGRKGEAPSVVKKEIEPLHRMRYFSGPKEKIMELLQSDPGRGEYIGITLTDERITPEIHHHFHTLLTARDSILMELISSFRAFGTAGLIPDEAAPESKPVEDLFAGLYREQNADVPPSDDEYEMMRYVGEMVRNRDPHEPPEEKEIARIVRHAKKTGENNG